MNRPCPVCDGSAADVLHTQRFVLPDGCPLPTQYDVVCCHICGFVFADVPAADYTGFYREQSKYAAPDGEWDRKRFADTARDIAAFVTNRQARILDVGCANGGLLTALHELGFRNLVGVEPSFASYQNAHRLNTCEIYRGSVDDMPDFFGERPSHTFDLVIFSHVLEHLPNPKAALRAVADVLAPDGCVYVEVPDAMRYGDFLFSPFLDFNTEHINHFSARGLMSIGYVCGLQYENFAWKTLETPAPYPAAAAFFRKAEIDRTPGVLGEFRPAIESYILRSRETMQRIDARLREVTGRVLVWGAGQLTYKLLADTCLGSMDIYCFIDGNPVYQGKRLRGRNIELSPRYEPGAFYSLPPYSIIVASLMHEGEIVNEIDRMGLTNDVILLGDA